MLEFILDIITDACLWTCDWHRWWLWLLILVLLIIVTIVIINCL